MPAVHPQSTLSRIFWFGVGGALSTMMNAGPFHLMRTYLGLRESVAYAISLTFVTVLLFVWNFKINFRTASDWRNCAWRYLSVVGMCWMINYVFVMIGLQIAGTWWPAVIATVQVGMGGVKFFLYHLWVYPREKTVHLLDEHPVFEP
jgi:putative flippase GtrA